MRKTMVMLAVLLAISIVAAGEKVEIGAKVKVKLMLKMSDVTDQTVRVAAGTKITLTIASAEFADCVFEGSETKTMWKVFKGSEQEASNNEVELKVLDGKSAEVLFKAAQAYRIEFEGELKFKDLSVSKCYSFPNPVVGSQKMRFAKVPKGATIKIFDMSGQKVWECEVQTESGIIDYDVVNKYGSHLASGGYIAVISAKGQKPRKITFAVIR